MIRYPPNRVNSKADSDIELLVRKLRVIVNLLENRELDLFCDSEECIAKDKDGRPIVLPDKDAVLMAVGRAMASRAAHEEMAKLLKAEGVSPDIFSL